MNGNYRKSNERKIRVPKDYFEQAHQLKREYFKAHRINVPLWRCMIALDKGNDMDDLFKRK